MMALELLDTKWAGLVQPDPDSAQAARLEPSTYRPRADLPRRTVTFRLRVYAATELARRLEDVRFAEIECLGGLLRSTNAWKSNLSRCRFRQAAVTETSVHGAVQPVTHARGTVLFSASHRGVTGAVVSSRWTPARPA